jgi:alkylated DNA nucleotide flippase Atl1
MKRTSSPFQAYMAYALLVSLFLQSCGGGFDNNPFVPIREDQRAPIQTSTQAILLPTNIHPLIGQELTAQGGHAVTFYENAGQLKADVSMNAPQGFSKSYEGLNVYIEQKAALINVSRLNTKAQERRIELQIARDSQPAKVVIYKGAGLVGGGDKGKEKATLSDLITDQAEEADDHLTRYHQLLTFAMEGEAEAQFQLGQRAHQLWKKGGQEKEAHKEALEWLEKAACQDHPKAISLLEELRQPILIEEELEEAGVYKRAVEETTSTSSSTNSTTDEASFTATIQLPDAIIAEKDEEKASLAEAILAETGAEPDVRLNVYHVLSQALSEQLESKDYTAYGEFQGRWKSLWMILQEPELLINKGPYNRFHQHPTRSPFPEAQVFAQYRQLNQKIANFKSCLQQFFPEHTSWPLMLDEVASFYDQFREQLQSCWSDPIRFNMLLEPKAIMMGEWWPGCFYRISQSQAHYLLKKDEYGKDAIDPLTEEDSNSDKKPKEPIQSTSNHKVSFLPEGNPAQASVYFKVNGMPSLNPSREYMLYSLYKKLGITVPASGLLILDHIKFGEAYSEEPFVLQASQAVKGTLGKKVLKENQTLPLDAEHFSRQVIGTLISAPNDAKPDNYIVTPVGDGYGWVGIDNDEVFQAPLNKDKTLHLKSVLLTLPEMQQVISAATRDWMLHLHPPLLMLAWLEKLRAQEKVYQSLKETLIAHINHQVYPRKGDGFYSANVETLWESLSLPFLSLHNAVIPTVVHLLEQIQAVIKENKGATLWALFQQCYPFISAYYGRLKAQLKDPYPILKEIYVSFGKKAEPLTLSSLTALQGPLEQEYFQVDKLGSTHQSIAKKIGVFLTASKLDIGKVMDNYCSLFDLKYNVLQPALSSLKLLTAYGFSQLQNARMAADLWAKGRSFAKKAELKDAWQAAFMPFRAQNQELDWFLMLEEHFPRGWKHSHKTSQDVQEIRGATLGKRRLTAPMKQVLLDKQGIFQANKSLSGRSQSNYYPAKHPLFYFKKYPEIPAYEYAATSLMRHLGLTSAPRSELLVFYNKKDGLYPVLLTQAIAGKPVVEVWKNDSQFSKLDPYKTGLLLLSSMLLNPEDSKEDNFILSPDEQQLVPIDNDHAFLPGAIQEEGLFKVYPQLQAKTLAFCLKEMERPLPSALVQQITSLNVDVFLQQWMRELIRINQAYQNAFSASQFADLYKKHGVIMHLPLSNLYIQGLYRKFYLLRTLLFQKPDITPLALLSRLEPYVGKQYAQVAHLPTLQNRFKEVTKSLYKNASGYGPRRSIANSRQMMKIMQIADEEVTAQADSFKKGPEAALSQLQALQKDRSVHDGRLQDLLHHPDEEKKAMSLEAEEQLIRQWFEDAECYDWISLPYSQRLLIRNLESFNFQNKGQYITAMDLRGAKNMREEGFAALYQACPNLQYLNISGWPIEKLGGFMLQKGLFSNTLIFSEGPILGSLKRLIVKACPNLSELKLHLPSLKSLEAADNEKLTKFSLHSPSLKLLDLTGHQITERIYLHTNSQASIILKGLSSKEKVILKAFQEQQESRLILNNRNLAFADILFLANHPIFRRYQEINLERNSIGNKGAIELSKVLAQSQLQILNLERNKIGDTGAIELAKVLAQSQLQMLNLEGNYIGEKGVIELAKVLAQSQLQILDLGWNNIGEKGAIELAKVLAQSQLQTLNLEGNNIGKKGVIELSKVLAKSQLQTLNLKRNKIEDEGAIELSKVLAESQLQTLGLGENDIEDKGAIELSKVLAESQLQTLNLEGNKVEEKGAIELAKVLAESQLQILDLEGNNIGDKGAIELSKVLAESQLQTLNLGKNDIGDAGAIELAKVLAESQLQALNLKGNKVEEKGAIELAKVLAQSQLQILDLEGNNIGDKGAIELSKVLAQSQLQTLDLRGNNIRAKGAIELAKVLAESQLQTLNLERNTIGDDGVIELAKVLAQSQLKTLNLGWNNIGGKGVIELSKVLAQSQLQTLNLRGNKIGVEGAIELSKVLAQSQLQTLNLEGNTIGGNNIGEKGVIELAKILAQSQLKTLNLGWNNIGAEGAIELAKVLAESQLQTLSLEWNNIGDKGAIELAKVLAESQLQTLNLERNNIGEKGVIELAKVLAESQLQTLSLEGNYIGNAGAIEIGKALAQRELQTLSLERNT